MARRGLVTEEKLLEEFSKINNELINTRRELLRLNAALAEKERFLARVLDLMPFAVYVLNLTSRLTEFSSRDIESLLGYDSEELLAIGDGHIPSLMHPEDIERYEAHRAVIRAVADGETVVFEYRLRDHSGAWRWIRSTDSVFSRDKRGEPERVIGIAEDISEAKRHAMLLEEASYIDRLTGIRNRRSFDELAEHQWRIANRKGAPFVVMFFDMDRFKNINDLYGHAEGDEALKVAAAILTDGFRSGDIIARFGGDEFIALLPDTDEAILTPLIARLRAATESWNACSGKPWLLRFSLGKGLYDPGNPRSLGAVVASADEDMYKDKTARRSDETA